MLAVEVDFVNIAVVVSGILVLLAVVMTLVLWQEEGRRSAEHTRAHARHTALGQPESDVAEDAELSA
jgi:hypothetical protein